MLRDMRLAVRALRSWRAGYGVRDLVVFPELRLAAVLVVMAAIYFSLFSAIQEGTVPFGAGQVLALYNGRRRLLASR